MLFLYFLLFLIKYISTEVYVDENGNYRCPLDPITERYADPTDKYCNQFFLCHKSHAFPSRCEVRTVFHPKLRECLARHTVPEAICPFVVDCKMNGYVADPEDCTKYYLCLYKQPVHYGCNSDFIFDSSKSQCVKNKEKSKACEQKRVLKMPPKEAYNGPKIITKSPPKIPYKKSKN